MEITESIFEKAFLGFNKIVKENSNVEILDFKKHPFIDKNENYKYDILDVAKNQLLTNSWREDEVGSGRILNSVKKSINININNLIDWRKKDSFKKLEENRENEKLLFDFFKSRIKDENAFKSFFDIGFSYQLIAYLFFIKNPQKNMPISQEQFDEIFASLNIDFKTSHNCSWENYQVFNELIKQFKIRLTHKFENITLLDAHSFLWIYGYQFKTKPEKQKKRTQIETRIIEQIPTPELELYQPRIDIDVENLIENLIEFDYLENHRRLMEIGSFAEKIAYESEIKFLKPNYPDLAEKVRIVSNDPKLGFDILSFESDGQQKQIEVKAISSNNKTKNFIITRNEFSKSKIYSNYYVYCVTEMDSETPIILRIKNPDFENTNEFKIEPLTYQVTFE